MNNKFYAEIESFFQTSGVISNSTIMVHSAFSRLMAMGVEPYSCCDFLCSYAADGNILMPTMTWKTVNTQNPIFYSNKTCSHTGILTEIFRKSFANKRSLHPTHSVAGVGENSRYFLDTHHQAQTPCGVESPYGVMVNSFSDLDVWVLLINVGLESCTLIHHFEEIIAPEIYVRNKSETYTLFDSNHNKSSIIISPHSNVMRDFHQYGRELYQRNNLFRLMTQNYSLLLFRAQDLSRLVTRNLKNNKYANLVGHSYVL